MKVSHFCPDRMRHKRWSSLVSGRVEGASAGEEGRVACKSQDVGIWGPVRNGLASSRDPKEFGAITWAGARGWTLQERGQVRDE